MAKKGKVDPKELAQYSDEEIFKIEIPANRYDLLCEEGIVRALRIFNQQEKTPEITVKRGDLVMNVQSEVCWVMCVTLMDFLTQVV